MFKKLKEKIKFLRWAYAHRNDSRASFEIGQIKYVTSQPKRYSASMLALEEDLKRNGAMGFVKQKLVSQIAERAIEDVNVNIERVNDSVMKCDITIWTIDSFSNI